MRRTGASAAVIGMVMSVTAAVAQAEDGRRTAAPAAAPAPAAFAVVAPQRVLDTREGLGATGPVGPARTVTVDLSAKVPASATAVVLNVTGTAPTSATFVTVFPAGTARPTASNVNLVAGETRPNLVTVAVGADRKVSLYNNSGSVHLIADLAGHYSTDPQAATGRFTPFTPVRVFDTREHFDIRPPGPIGPGGVETLDLSVRVPPTATAVVLTLTGTGATAGTFLTAWPGGTPRPTASNVNLAPGATTPNQVVVALGADRTVNLYNRNGTAHAIVDVAGFYSTDYGALFTAVAPTRVLDTRAGAGPVGPVRSVAVALGASVPRNTTGVVLNLTGTLGTAGTYVTAWAPPEPRPDGSNLNLTRGQTAANHATVGLGTGATVSLYNNTGSVHLIADLAGFFSLPPVTCAADCVLAWGNNWWGNLGTGDYEPSAAVAKPVYGLSGVTALSSGTANLALTADGQVWAWGANFSAELGNGWYGSESSVPVPVLGLHDVVAIDDLIALRGDGTVWTWGTLLGGGFTVPEQVPGVTGAVAVAGGGGSAFALKGDGTVWAWGSNYGGALGIGGDDAFFTEPTQVPGLSGVREIVTSGQGTLVRKDDGTVWGWGNNRHGQLGHGTVGGEGCIDFPPVGEHCQYRTPVQAVGLTDVTALDLNGVRSFAVRADGTAWAWGNNHEGSLGTGEDCRYCGTGTPTRITGLPAVTQAVAANAGGYALGVDGRVWAWGTNDEDALGEVEGTAPAYSTVPLRLRAPVGVRKLEGGSNTGFALK
ncbi:RCC1 domain-containing protein [Actinophytocola xinjiangensis]|uniref:RCC1 domain-containing protein n=1 Tax=Actinophytocola xinjiangensis TaxID=485602 RepID=UPI000B000863|nr:hypothetical protein [Actinophytocola xinjiangensis]